MLWRQGDVLIEMVAEIPSDAKPKRTSVLVYGEATGHAHRVETPEHAQVFDANGTLYLRVTEATRLIHDEHLPIALARGNYHIWQQREYTPQAIQTIRD